MSQTDKRSRQLMKAVWSKLKPMLLENWGYKLLALVFAIALWAGLIAQDPTLTREKDFENVSINVIGADALKRNGFIVLDDLEQVLGNVELSVNVPQGQYAAAQASNYSVRIDLSRINTAGEQNVRILSTNSSTYGTVTRVSPASVTLHVDEYVTRYRIPVTVELTEGMSLGYYASEPSTNPPMVAVSGPKSVVMRIASVKVQADQSTLPQQEGVSRRALAFTLVDELGEPIESDLVQVTNESVLLDSVIVEQTVYPTSTISLSDVGLVIGEPAEGYEVKGVYITPAHITIAGRANAIQDVNLLYGDGNININGKTQSVTKTIRVRQLSTLEYISTDSVSVAVEIGPVMVDRTWTYVPIMVTGIPAGYDVQLSQSSVSFMAHGAQIWLDELHRAEMLVRCDLSSITKPGTYTVPLSCEIGGADGQTYTCDVEPGVVQVVVQEKTN